MHKTSNVNLLACADKELIGKTFKEKNLEIEVKESFYKGKEVNEKELKVLFKEADNINLLGEKCISAAKKDGIIKDSDIIRINGVPHAQIYKI